METFFDTRNHPKIKLAVGGAKQSNLVELEGKRETVPATLTAGAEALAGTALLAQYELWVNFPRKKITLQKV